MRVEVPSRIFRLRGNRVQVVKFETLGVPATSLWRKIIWMITRLCAASGGQTADPYGIETGYHRLRILPAVDVVREPAKIGIERRWRRIENPPDHADRVVALCDDDGKIIDILVQNSDPVEYNQPLYIIDPF